LRWSPAPRNIGAIGAPLPRQTIRAGVFGPRFKRPRAEVEARAGACFAECWSPSSEILIDAGRDGRGPSVMMDISQRKEQFSIAYVRAIASVAGFTVSRPDTDEDSEDMILSGRIVEGVPSRPKIVLQLKCTSEDVLRKDEVVYRLKRKNYDELRLTGLILPRILVVVHIPRSEEEWLRHTEDELALRRCGYWLSLFGMPETTTASLVTVRLPRVNVFDVAGLRSLMGRAARKEPL
jgi:Domain of unknown function (DUF4365)